MDIVEELRQDREKGARRLVEEYKTGLLSLAMRFCHDTGDAEELVNRTFAAVVEGIDGFLEQSSFFTWMCQILVNINANDNRRKSSGEIVYPGELPDVADESAEGSVYSALDASLLRDAIKTLPAEIRKTVVLHYFMEMSVKDIARFLAIPSGTVLWRLHYARQMLAVKLGVATEKAKKAVRKSGAKALLLALALCALTAAGAVAIARWGELSERAAVSNVAGTSPAALVAASESRNPNPDGESRNPNPAQASDNPTIILPSTTLSKEQPMNSTTLRTIAASAAVAAATAATPANANTVAWWHFDEADPGAVTAVDTIASGMSPEVYAQPYSLSDATATKASGAYLPVFAKPFRGLCVYDPVSGEKRVNRAAMKFTTAEGAKYGGALHVLTTDGQYASCTGAITVEAFVCTTGGVFSTFAPIVACMEYEKWTNEKWAIYMETDGTIALRFLGSPYYSGNSQAGKAKINDGAWHHVALTWDGATVKVFVDYEQDKFTSNGNPRQFSQTGTIGYNYGGQWDFTRIGGYTGKSGEATARRRFNGLIDEVRVSNVALTPDQFLRLQRLDTIEDEIVRVSFEADEYGVIKKDFLNLADDLGSNRPKVVFRAVSGADGPTCYDCETKAGDIIAAGMYSDELFENVASFYQATNSAGKANYIEVQAVSGMIKGSAGTTASYTIETFFKTRGIVTGGSDHRQVVFKFGTQPWINVLFNASSERNLLYVFYLNGTLANHYIGSTVSNVDDGNWHHVACVVDGTANPQTIRFYIDYRLDKAFSGMLPDIGEDNYIFVGANERGEGRWFDGWLDDIRVTRRALTPAEFLTTHPVGSGDASLLALFENDYTFICASNSAFSVTGVGEARTGGDGVAPIFVKDSRGNLLLDGTDGTVEATNEYSAEMNKSRVVFPESHLYEAESYTVEFLAKFTGIVDENGSVAADSKTLKQHAPILRFVRNDSSTNFDWFLFRKKDDDKALQMSIQGSYPSWTLSNTVVDGKWHHYAFTVAPKDGDDTKTCVQLFYDYKPQAMETVNARIPYRFAGHRLMIGEGTYDEPNLQFEMDALRFSKGVIDPSRFMARSGVPFTLVIR